MTAVHILVTAYVLYYLLAHAMITHAVWSRYPAWLDKFMSCAACSGAWLTLGVAFATKSVLGWQFLGLDATRGGGAVMILFWGCFGVPLLAALHLRALDYTTPRTSNGE